MKSEYTCSKFVAVFCINNTLIEFSRDQFLNETKHLWDELMTPTILQILHSVCWG